MGQNESKAPPKSKINQTNVNKDIKTVGSKQSSSEMENASVSYFKEETGHFDRGKHPNRLSVDTSELFTVDTKVGFHNQGDIHPSLESKKPDLPNQSKVLKLENQPAPLNASRLEIHTKEPVIFATKQPQKHNYEQEPSFPMSQPLRHNQSLLFPTPQLQGQKDGEQPTLCLTTQPQGKRDENLHDLFSTCQLQEQEDGNQLNVLPTSLPQGHNDNKQPVIFLSKHSQGMKVESNSSTFPTTQPERQKDGKQPDLFLTTQPKENTNKNQPVLFPASQPQGQKYENQPNMSTTNQSQGHKDDNQSFLFSTTQPQVQTSETQQATSPMSQPQVRRHDKQPDLFSIYEPQRQGDDKHSIFSNAEPQGQIHGNQHVAFVIGQPLIQIPNFSSLHRNPKEICHPDLFNINKPPNSESITMKPAMENKPSKKIISSGNPFLKSSNNGKVAKDIFDINVNGHSMVISPTRTDTSGGISPIKEAKNCIEKDTLVAPNHPPAKVLNVPLCKSHDNLVGGAFKKKSSCLRVAGCKGSTKDEIIKKTLKHFDMIAESLTSSTDKNKPQESARTEYTDSQNKEKHNHSMLHNCIVRIKNIRENDKEFMSSLQTELVTHLKEMALLTSVLKTYSVVNPDIYSVCETIRDNLSILMTNYQTKNICGNIDSKSTCKVEVLKNVEGQNPMYSLAENQINGISHVVHDNTNNIVGNNLSATSTVTKELITEDDGNKKNIPPLNPFMTMLDRLPSDLIEEKQNISLRNSELYCRICEKPVAFAFLNLIEHLRGKNHSALVATLKESASVCSRDLSHQSDLSSSNKPTPSSPNYECLQNACQTMQEIEPALNITLPPNYGGVLDLISKSVEEDFNIGVDVFICLLCDNLQNDKAEALNHIRADHKDSHNTVWHFCKTCEINIYGTDSHFKEHCYTAQHINIAKLIKIRCPLKELSKVKGSSDIAPVTEEFDRGSVCSSKSDTSNKSSSRMKPHEILLAIAKDKKDKNISGPYGLYCQVCRKYIESVILPEHLVTKQHTQNSTKQKFRTKMSNRIWECSTCDVYLYGDGDVWKEHQNLQIHKELLAPASKGNNKSSELRGINRDDVGELSSQNGPPKAKSLDCYKPNISKSSSTEDIETDSSKQLASLNESGPHYDLMKRVLKKHLDKTPDDVVYGLYCHLCQLYFIDKKQWESHLNSNSHKSRINSSECLGRKVQHDCVVCNIHLVCDETFFSLHLQSLAHKAISRIPSRRQKLEETESEDDSSEDESNSSENYDGSEEEILGPKDDKKGNLNITGREGRTNNLICVKNGIYFRGFPKNVEYKTINEYFKKFGPLKSCKVDKQRGCGSVVFKNNVDANALLQKKTVFINKTPVMVRPLMANTPVKREKTCLHPDVVRVLSSWPDIQAVVSRQLSEMSRNYSFNQQKGVEINQDLSAVVPGCKVIFFGSQVTGLATGRSDFDIYMDFDGISFYKDLSSDKQECIIKHLYYHLRQPRSKFLVKEVILEARVPIIRVEHIRTRTQCDISCRSGLSVENSQLVRMYLEYDPRVRWLVVAVKFWMEANGLLDRNAFTSYATVWLVLFFLMNLTNPVICPVVTLQQDCKPHTIAKWDCRFHRDTRDVYRYFRSSNRQSELVLLALFFQTYAKCPYKGMVLCPLNGQLLARNQFETFRLPREFGPYLDKIQFTKGAEKLRTQTPVCLQDPFDLSHNITKGVSRRDLVKFKKLCNQSYKMCQNLLARNAN